jgi:hypothetical protein
MLTLQRSASNGNVARFVRGTGAVGSISVTASATSYNTTSDYRLKENVVSLSGAIARLNQLSVYRFNFIVDPTVVVDGFIAHEAQEVVPECVTGEKDEVDADGNPVMQGIDQSKLVPLLTAALQEAIAKIEQLEQRLAAAGMNPALLSVLVATLNWNALIPAQRAYSTFTVKQGIVRIATSAPTNHLAGLIMKTGKKGVTGF